jgi:uncharacterized membrane protein
MNEEILIGFMILGVVVGVPVATLILALVNRHRVKRLRAAATQLQEDHDDLRMRFGRLLQRLQRLEGPVSTEVLAVEEVEAPEAPEPVAPEPEAPAEPPPAERPSPPPSAGRPVPTPAPPPTAPAASRAPSPPRAEKAGAGFSLESSLGGRLWIWLGAVALAMAGVFLVKWSFDQGLITPAARVVLAIAFGVALLGAGEWLVRRSRRVASALSAAGIAVLFAAFLAGVNLYDLIPRTVGFGLLALTAAVAVLLSLRQGAIVALVGLVGGFLMPALIGSEEPRPWPLFTYLFLLLCGLLFVSRRRGWWPVAGLTLVGAMVWAGAWIVMGHFSFLDPLPIGLFLLFSVAAFVVAARPAREKAPWGSRKTGVVLGWAGAALGLGLLGVLLHVGEFSTLEWSFLAVLGAGCLVLARLDASYEGLGWLAAAFCAVLLLIWSFDLDPGEELRFALTTLALGVLFAGGSYLALWGARSPARWAALSAVSALAFLLTAYHGLHEREVQWGWLSLGLAVVYVALAVPVARFRERMEGGTNALAALAVGVTALVSLAAPLELERAWISVAWAVEVPALAWIAGRLRVRALHTVAWILAGGVVVRLALNPMVFGYPTGDTVIFNWLLYGYGIPILAFAGASFLFRRLEDTRLAEALAWGAELLGFLLIGLQVRQYFHAGDLDASDFDLAEWGALTVFWLLYAWGLLLAGRRFPRRSLLWGGRIAAGAAMAQALLAQCLVANPLFVRHGVGDTLVFNSLLWVYGVPAVLALLVARDIQEIGRRPMLKIAGVFSLLMTFLLVTTEVRQGFKGTFIHMARGVTEAEMYSHSAAWVLLGIALLVVGIVTRKAVPRFGSLAVMLLAVGKVFLLDTAHLEDLYRVLSFFGLGVSLLVLAFLYQKFVFREEDR